MDMPDPHHALHVPPPNGPDDPTGTVPADLDALTARLRTLTVTPGTFPADVHAAAHADAAATIAFLRHQLAGRT
jgi:hypothetical protein